MKRKILLAVVVITIVYSSNTKGDLLTGSIDGLVESNAYFYWGDGINDLYQVWSVSGPDSSGWFYGSSYPWSNADVYVYSGLSDISLVTDASVFDYHDSSSLLSGNFAVKAYEGDTVFFKGTNGYYGAWYIEDIYPDSTVNDRDAALNGQWYFIDDGTSDFSVPEPTTLLLLGMGGLLIRKRK
jgi:hypothetical protein